MNKHHLVQQLAPLAPPCFDSRLQWVTYLVSAAFAQHPGEPGPLIFEAGKPVRFDHAWDFCVDCDAAWRREQRVVERGVCRPQWLRQFEPKEAASAA